MSNHNFQTKIADTFFDIPKKGVFQFMFNRVAKID